MVTGYTRAHLRRLVRTGRLRNVGSDAVPEFLLADLPRKLRNDEYENIADEQRRAVSLSKQVARAIVRGEG